MKVCFDTNVIIDIWGRTEGFFAPYSSLDVALSEGMDVCISAGSLFDFAYILAARKHASKKQARQMISEVLDVFKVLDLTVSDARQANESAMNDYEDGLIVYSASRCNVDFIITGNKKDFVKSPVPVLTPEQFVDIYKPDYLEYEMVDL